MHRSRYCSAGVAQARHRINQLWPPFRRLLRMSRVCRVDNSGGQAPNVSRRMGAEMDSAGDERAAPDEQ